MDHERIGLGLAIRIEAHCGDGASRIPERYHQTIGELVERWGWANVERAVIAQLTLAERMPSLHPELGIAGPPTPAAVAMVLERLPGFVRSMVALGRRSD